ncbi:MAG: hypothetical protein KatS3mg057_2553 [Herpetosiphonaceae bacterium]|nr:MAG: hypothetical protein KatS3mg057_2553 [Herpetosiphonaceae bacterium]
MRSRWYLLTLVFFGGVCSLGLELAAFNLLAPYFGTSRLIWANIIGLTLLYLTVGYTIGGRLADRRPELHILCAIMAAAGLFSVLIPMTARPILRWSLEAFTTYNVGIFFSSFFGVLILFSVPVILLGMVSPYAIRLDVRDIHGAGRTAGSLYALSTVGSLVGTFLPTLLLTPADRHQQDHLHLCSAAAAGLTSRSMDCSPGAGRRRHRRADCDAVPFAAARRHHQACRLQRLCAAL